METPETTKQQLAICIRNDSYPVSLEVRKVYRVVPDAVADELHFIRVIDESGEEYLYPRDYFIPIDLPDAIREALFITA